MAEESKLADLKVDREAADEVLAEQNRNPGAAQVEDEEDEDDDVQPTAGSSASGATAKKKKSKRKRIKAALGVGAKDKDATKDDISKAVGGLSKAQVSQLLAMNPALAGELGVTDGDLSGSQAAAALKKLSLQDIMTGLAANGKNVKDMGSYKFWQTQPVPKLGEQKEIIEEGPFKIIDVDKVPKEPAPLMEGFEWVTMDLTTDEELKELVELLYAHYVEDAASMFRLKYSESVLKWALLAPGWRKEWHVGVRATKSRKLVAFISAVPAALRVREKVLSASEVNFLCIHKKLRSKRLTPVLIKEITRRCYLHGIYQAVYTGGTVLPTPVSTTRYFHRSLDWQKLYDIGFSPLPPNSKPQYQIRKYALPEQTATKGLRPVELKDVDAVLDLLKRYLARYDMAPVMTKEEVEHWLVYKKDVSGEQVVWSYVVEDPTTKEITDFFSFYVLESTIIDHNKYDRVRTAYLFYYATEVAFQPEATRADLKARLNPLINDALIIAKQYKFDVFNALSLMDNALFLDQQKFGRGDGQLHYYLYNYNANPISGGVDMRNELDESTCSGLGLVML
ncbi:MAG: glycylpeptide N-tetradecanoyltransferase [Claussenomyces sp. TS43310]|nr:MAG: glycylpeptide N-tetradecanoyltransferase [Claussenomyces sp. TS43310]